VVSEDYFNNSVPKLIHKDLSVLEIGPYSVQVESGRFKIELAEAPEIRLLDFVSKVFGELLPHTKISKFGINKTVHFRVADASTRIKFGRKLAPIEPWGAFGQRIAKSPEELTGGMFLLKMREMLKADDWVGHHDAMVEPSNVVGGNVGIMVRINKHFEVLGIEDHDGADKAMNLLNTEFEESLKQSDDLIEHLIKVAVDE
jgi:hypothetical protein